MQLLLISTGLLLIVVGLYFAIGGFGMSRSSGGLREVQVEGPAWLIVVAFGLGLLVFSAIWDWEQTTFTGAGATRAENTTTTTVTDDESASSSSSTTTSSAPSSTTTSTDPAPSPKPDPQPKPDPTPDPKPATGVELDIGSLSPASPHTFTVGEKLTISIAYTSHHAGPVQIWARPTTGDYGASGSNELGPGSGTHPQSFTLNSPGTVTRIRVHAVDAATNALVAEAFFDVDYSWEAEVVAAPATPTHLSPSNGSVFDDFPRETTLSWTSVAGAVSYNVETAFQDPTSGRWIARDNADGLISTSFTFNFVGAQPGRWRVSAVNAEGLVSAPSPWWTFRYTV